MREADKLVYSSPSVSTADDYNISIELDGTLSVPPLHTFTILTDPDFDSFNEGKRIYQGGVLQIKVSITSKYSIIIIIISSSSSSSIVQ